MKDQEFIELLNLYLDHEISPSDAARLEAEVQADPRRRKVYEEYCRMQKACKVLAAEFQAEPAPGHDRKVVDFPSSGPRTSGFYTLGAMAAAAACVAIIFAGRQREEAAARLAAPVAAAVSQPPVPVVPARSAAPGLVSAPLSLSGQAGAVLVSAATSADQPELEWVRQFQLAPIPSPVAVETLRFEARPASLQAPSGAVRSPAAPAPTAEMTAFRFQR